MHMRVIRAVIKHTLILNTVRLTAIAFNTKLMSQRCLRRSLPSDALVSMRQEWRVWCKYFKVAMERLHVSHQSSRRVPLIAIITYYLQAAHGLMT
jgi:hypothetical protein